MIEPAGWHKSSYSANGANCVEVSEGPVTGVRDTQNRELGQVKAPAAEWTAFVKAAVTSA